MSDYIGKASRVATLQPKPKKHDDWREDRSVEKKIEKMVRNQELKRKRRRLVESLANWSPTKK